MAALHWVFVVLQGLSLVVTGGGYPSLQCEGFSLQWLLLLQSTGSRHPGLAAVAHGCSCSAACGIFLDQGLNLCPLRWQEDSCSLYHRKVLEPNSGITRWSICSRRCRSSIHSAKTRLGTDSDSDHELLIAKFRLILKKVGKTTRPFRYDLNQITYSGGEK